MGDIEAMIVSDKKREKLARKLASHLGTTYDDAMSIIYDEWDTVEYLFQAHGKVKTVLFHLVEDINASYRIA